MIPRYSRKQMSDIWELENKFRVWLDIELAVCEVRAEKGLIPADDMKEIKEKADFDLKRIEEIEAEVHHDVIAFLTAVGEKIGPASRHVHYGLTSSDIGDTALCIQLRQAGMLILEGLDRVIDILEHLSRMYKNTPCMGRSHGVHAEPTTFGAKMLLYHQAFLRNRHRMAQAIAAISVGKLSGAVGTFSNIEPDIEEKVCLILDLKPDPVSTQVISRDRHAEFMAVLGIIAGTMDQLATEIRHLQRTEVREVEEPFQKGQKGSSAMPHKRNPILCERITGLARVIKANVSVALDNITLWHERDISHSSAERVVIADSTMAIDYLLDKLAFILGNLHVYPENMIKNINITGGLFYSQTLLLALIEKGLQREDAYAIVQEHAMAVWGGDSDLKSRMSDDPRVQAILTGEDINTIFNLNRFLENIDSIYKKAGVI